MSVYLGLDASTQSLTAVLIDVGGGQRRMIGERSLVYDEAFPGYGTRHGVQRGADPLVVVTPPLLWVDALDRLVAELAAEFRPDLARLAAVAGSAQQHGSVYLNAEGLAGLVALDPARRLADQMAAAFARPLSPVWMDSSTTAECREIEAAVGGAETLAQRTGSRAFERFTGPQIRAFAKREPAAYARTARIHLVSSFLASLLAGADAPIDPGDGSGMNLLDLRSGSRSGPGGSGAPDSWWRRAIDATAPDLDRRLPAVQPSWTVAGRLAPYWRVRYGLPAARVVLWSGDNPCSVIGSGVVRAGRLAISLGTSDTVCGLMREPRVEAGAGYVSASPTGGFMGTTVFKNGSLARERVRDAYGLDWAGFSAALAANPPGNHGAILLPWFDPEITPHVAVPEVRRFDLDPADVAGNVRAIVEAQMMAMANHSRWMGTPPAVIHATGGAAGNRAVLQVMADVFGAEVVRSRTRNGAALGAALRAWHADRLASGAPLEWDEVVTGFTDPDPAWRFPPRPETAAVYARLRARYADCEAAALRRPVP
jgi:xylulokinase